MIESVENISEYHNVFAQSIVSTMNAVIAEKDHIQKELAKYCIEYAYTQYRESSSSELSWQDILKEIKELQLDKKSKTELNVLMAYYQAKAGMKANQITKHRAQIYEKIRAEL